MDVIKSSDMTYGDVVLNVGDTLYEHKPPEETARDHVVRILAYTLFANRVGLPTRHIVASDGLYLFATWAPELFEEGILFADVPEGRRSFAENVETAEYATTADIGRRAAFLDSHSKYIHAFNAGGMMVAFREAMLRDLRIGGPLYRLICVSFPEHGVATAGRLLDKINSMPPMRHDPFVSGLRSAVSSEYHDLLARWAAVRYYTTPMNFDVCIRDLPHEAVQLIVSAEAEIPTHIQDPDATSAVPQPMRSAIDVIDLSFPLVMTEGDAKSLGTAVLKTRAEVPEAQGKFASIVSSAFESQLVAELNGRLRDNLNREHLLSKGSPSLSDAFKRTVEEGGWGLLLELAAGPLGHLVGGIRAALEERHEHAEMRERAPWKVACEYLHHSHEAARRLAGLGQSER
jgi:hypothetical protein